MALLRRFLLLLLAPWSANACPLPAADAGWLILLERARCVSPTLRAEGQRLSEARAAQAERRAAEGGSFTALLQPQASWQRDEGRGSTARSAQAQIQWQRTLLDQGAAAARTRSAAALAEAQALQREERGQQIALQLAQRLIDGLAAEAALLNAQASERELQASSDLAAARERAGAGTRVDRLRAEAQAAQARGSRLQAEQELSRARLAWAQELDWPADASAPAWPADFETALETEPAAHEHPDDLRRQQRIASLAASREATRGEGQGQLSLTASLGQSLSRQAGSRRSPQDAALLLSWSRSFGDGGAQQAREAQAQAREWAERDERDAAQRERRQSLLQQRTRAAQAQALLPARELALQAAQEALAAAEGRLRAGAGTLSELLDAQSQLASSRQQRDRSRLDLLAARAQILRDLAAYPR